MIKTLYDYYQPCTKQFPLRIPAKLNPGLENCAYFEIGDMKTRLRTKLQPLTVTVMEKNIRCKTPGKLLMKRSYAYKRRHRVLGGVPGFKLIIIISSASFNIVAFDVYRERSLPWQDCTCHQCHLLSR